MNDLAVFGATPHYLSLTALIEEGLELATLERIVANMATAAANANVRIVCGDTKVVPRGQGSGLYLATTGIGTRRHGLELSMQRIQVGDAILVSGPVGDHGTAVMLAREEFGLRGDLQSDAASVLPLTETLLPNTGLRFMRDPTRGGLAGVLNEIRQGCGRGVRVWQDRIPIREPVTSVCDMLGYDPLYLACEGRVVAVVAPEQAAAAVSAWRELSAGREAAIIGEITHADTHVVLATMLGGERVLEELEDDPLPRIC